MSQVQITLETAISEAEKQGNSIEKAIESNSSYSIMKQAGIFNRDTMDVINTKQLRLPLPISANCEVIESDSLVEKNSLGKPNLLKILVGPGQQGKYYCKLSRGEYYTEDLLAVTRYLQSKEKLDKRPALQKKMSLLSELLFSVYRKDKHLIDAFYDVFSMRDTDKVLIAFEKISRLYDDATLASLEYQLKSLNKAVGVPSICKLALILYNISLDYQELLKELDFSEKQIEQVFVLLNIKKSNKNETEFTYEEQIFYDALFEAYGSSWEDYKKFASDTYYFKFNGTSFYGFSIVNQKTLDFATARIALLAKIHYKLDFKTVRCKEHYQFIAVANILHEIEILNEKILEYGKLLEKQKEEEAKVIQAQPEEEQPPF